MGSPGFNRQAFVTRQERTPRGSNSLGALLLLVAGIGVIGVGGYAYTQAGGNLPDFNLPGAESDQGAVAARLDELEQRLERLEKRRGLTPPATPEPHETDGKDEPAVKGEPAAAPGTAPAANLKSGEPRANDPASPKAPPVDSRRLAEMQRRYSSLEAEVSADRQRWNATTDRVTDTVAELGEQRGELADQRQRVEKLWQRFERVPVQFELDKSGKQRVGPVQLWLRRTDQKNHRYTLRVFADDKWIELKDRALLEPVELYLAEVPVPLELVVNQITEDRVQGVLGVPRALPPR